MLLFEPEAAPSEQRDVADSHPDVATRLKALFDENDGEAAPRAVAGFTGLRRIKGGELRYDSILP